MRKFTAPLVLTMAMLSSNANADFLGLYVGGGVWDHDPSGTFGTIGDDIINVESDLNYGGENDTYVWAAFEHFVPLIPNVRVEMASMGHTGTAANVTFDGVTLPGTGASSVNLDTTDAILYYRLLDNWVNFDLGLNLRKVEGDFTIDDRAVPISETIPMLYLAAQFDLPFSGFSVGADISKVSYDGSSYQDLRLRALYEMGVIGFEAGIRSTSLELDDVDTINADLEFEGIMLGAFLHF
ncbi:MAG: TIGR04219 family outer membrane beta-barrel protein [Gammaproteobacteria bacterium]|nr:TIGR04219 family outer membrane beta-barrel protein [Gammaproteobacteria bacterium]